MSVKIEKLEGSKVKMEFKIEAAKFNDAVDKAFKINGSKFKVQGFRAGKVPRNIVEKTYGESVMYDEAFNIIAEEEYSKAVIENNLSVVSRPEVDIKEIGNNKDLEFNIVVYTKPEVEIKGYKDIKIDKVDTKVTEKDIDAEIEIVRGKNARIITKEKGQVENGNITVIDFEGFLDGVAFEGGKGEKYELEIGSNSFIPGFEEQIIGMKIGEEKEITTTFPKEYQSKDLAGKTTIFKVKLHEIKVKEMPKLDDEFAKDVSEFETLVDYRKSVKDKLELTKKGMAKAEKETKIMEKLAELVKVEIPGAMIDAKVDSMLKEFEDKLATQGLKIEQYLEILNTDIEKLKLQFKDNAIKDIKISLAMESIEKQEKFEVTEKDVDKKIDELAKEYGQSSDSLKTNPNAREYMKNRLVEDKIIEFLVDNVKEK